MVYSCQWSPSFAWFYTLYFLPCQKGLLREKLYFFKGSWGHPSISFLKALRFHLGMKNSQFTISLLHNFGKGWKHQLQGSVIYGFLGAGRWDRMTCCTFKVLRPMMWGEVSICTRADPKSSNMSGRFVSAFHIIWKHCTAVVLQVVPRNLMMLGNDDLFYLQSSPTHDVGRSFDLHQSWPKVKQHVRQVCQCISHHLKTLHASCVASCSTQLDDAWKWWLVLPSKFSDPWCGEKFWSAPELTQSQATCQAGLSVHFTSFENIARQLCCKLFHATWRCLEMMTCFTFKVLRPMMWGEVLICTRTDPKSSNMSGRFVSAFHIICKHCTAVVLRVVPRNLMMLGNDDLFYLQSSPTHDVGRSFDLHQNWPKVKQHVKVNQAYEELEIYEAVNNMLLLKARTFGVNRWRMGRWFSSLSRLAMLCCRYGSRQSGHIPTWVRWVGT